MPQEKKKRKGTKRDYAEGLAETKAIRGQKLQDAIKSLKNQKKARKMPGEGSGKTGPSGSKPVYKPLPPTRRTE